MNLTTPEPCSIHAVCDEDGRIDVMTFTPEDKANAKLLVNAPKLRRLLACLVDALDFSEAAVLKRGYVNTDKEQAALLAEARKVLAECETKS